MWVQEIPGGQATCSKALPGLFAFPCPLSQKWKARPLLASSVNKEEGTCRLYLKQNGDQAGFANGSGNGENGLSLLWRGR